MIPCPICTAPTRVRETRGNRRSRRCTALGCEGAITTVELDAGTVELLRRMLEVG